LGLDARFDRGGEERGEVLGVAGARVVTAEPEATGGEAGALCTVATGSADDAGGGAPGATGCASEVDAAGACARAVRSAARAKTLAPKPKTATRTIHCRRRRADSARRDTASVASGGGARVSDRGLSNHG
jgi:hypothetical protein